MSTTTFDTLTAVRALEAAGMESAQAEERASLAASVENPSGSVEELSGRADVLLSAYTRKQATAYTELEAALNSIVQALNEL